MELITQARPLLDVLLPVSFLLLPPSFLLQEGHTETLNPGAGIMVRGKTEPGWLWGWENLVLGALSALSERGGKCGAS